MLKTFEVNPIQENCYVLSDESREAVIIDCGALFPDELKAIADYIEAAGLKPVAHLLTHTHFDHIFGARFIADTYGLLPRFAAPDLCIYERSDQQATSMFGQPIRLHLPEPGPHVDADTVITYGTHRLTVIPTPGHTPGGVCYYDADARLLFSGDTLFRASIGRTDLPGGDYATLMASLDDLLAAVPADASILPGHGPATTLADERCINPYLRR